MRVAFVGGTVAMGQIPIGQNVVARITGDQVRLTARQDFRKDASYRRRSARVAAHLYLYYFGAALLVAWPLRLPAWSIADLK